jgi:uncharacterized tellurite resistance protein B-like protein
MRVPTMWIAPGQQVVVHGSALAGGMLYVGSTLMAPDGSAEPAQIDPALDVDPAPASPHERPCGSRPRYHELSATARRAYLTWLMDGRRDPNADIGYVFLFFYGLERRVLLDAAADALARAEIPAIQLEIERLRGIYDDNSFLRHSSDLLDFLEAASMNAGMPLAAAPPDTSNRGMSLRLKVGLGQCAVNGQPVPSEWALAWARSEPNLRMSRVALRCARQFDAQFKQIYRDRYGEGLKLAVNRSRLKISYRPASGGLLQTFTTNLGTLPDVTTAVTPLKMLQDIVDAAAEGLDAYARFIGLHADRVLSLEATLLLPKPLWPKTVMEAVRALDQRIRDGMVVIKLGELLDVFGGTANLTRETLKAVFELLHTQQIGVEPEMTAGARTPKPEDSVVLFRLATAEAGQSAALAGDHESDGYDGHTYDAMAVMLDLAITLANADGKISRRELQLLNAQVEAWSHVGAAAQQRLRARLRLGVVYPPTLSSLKSRIEPLPVAARAALGKLLSALALADGKLRPAAVKHLEKLYALLGIKASALYGQLHRAAAAADDRSRAVPGGAPLAAAGSQALPRAKSPRGSQLDSKRIAALQAESERVTALLSKVFEDQEQLASPAVVPPEKEPDILDREPRLLGLDPEHSAFLRVLLTRPSWSRAELDDIAADMELMLDGALERVNEAALDAFEQRVAEGDDPVEIARELLEEVIA